MVFYLNCRLFRCDSIVLLLVIVLSVLILGYMWIHSPEERELVDECTFSIFLYEPWILVVKALQSGFYIPYISFSFCYNDRGVIGEKIFIKNKCLVLFLAAIQIESVMLNFLWIKNIIVVIQLIDKRKAPFELLD